MKAILTFGILLLIFSCSLPKKTEKQVNDPPFYSKNKKSSCLDSLLLEKSNEITGPIKMKLFIESIESSKQIFSFDTIIEINLDVESELIILDEKCAMKFFHIEITEYGNLIHLVRYDFFYRENEIDCWNVEVSSDYAELLYSKREENDVSYSRFSARTSNHKNYLIVKYNLYRVQ
ncbi:MAG: hypothetical protein PHZ24_13425 [Bacteroidales bacterium]|nr:hypothetical protein [Bacteroidales bacterium]MDY0141449.1 hypothetical protein [Bacteroidales bacterium]